MVIFCIDQDVDLYIERQYNVKTKITKRSMIEYADGYKQEVIIRMEIVNPI